MFKTFTSCATYRGYDIVFFIGEKIIRAAIWIPNSATLVCKFIRDDYDFDKLEKSVKEYLDSIDEYKEA